jgi:hypothetical protein
MPEPKLWILLQKGGEISMVTLLAPRNVPSFFGSYEHIWVPLEHIFL